MYVGSEGGNCDQSVGHELKRSSITALKYSIKPFYFLISYFFFENCLENTVKFIESKPAYKGTLPHTKKLFTPSESNTKLLQ